MENDFNFLENLRKMVGKNEKKMIYYMGMVGRIDREDVCFNFFLSIKKKLQ